MGYGDFPRLRFGLPLLGHSWLSGDVQLGFGSKREGEAPAEPFWPTRQEAQQAPRPPENTASPGFETKLRWTANNRG